MKKSIDFSIIKEESKQARERQAEKDSHFLFVTLHLCPKGQSFVAQLRKRSCLIVALIFFLSPSWAAPPSYPQPYPTARPAPGEDLSSILRHLNGGLVDLKHEVRNHESEIRLFQNKWESQETSFEHLQQQLIEDLRGQRDLTRAININFEGKTDALDASVKNLDALVKGLMGDIRQIKSQANDSILLLGQYKQKLSELDSLLETQSQHMQNLEAALQSIMEVWKAKEASKEIGKGSEALRLYKVQPGDSLLKIALAQKVSVQALRACNPLIKEDRIIAGQTLNIPQ